MNAREEKCSRTPSLDLLKRQIGTSPAPRMLTRYEIELLKESEREVIEIVRLVLRTAPKTGMTEE